MNEEYVNVEIEVIAFENEDIITTSCPEITDII